MLGYFITVKPLLLKSKYFGTLKVRLINSLDIFFHLHNTTINTILKMQFYFKIINWRLPFLWMIPFLYQIFQSCNVTFPCFASFSWRSDFYLSFYKNVYFFVDTFITFSSFLTTEWKFISPNLEIVYFLLTVRILFLDR